MKKVILSAVLVAGITANLFAQGQVHIDNFGGGGNILVGTTVSNAVPDNRLDLSLALWGGASAGSLSLIAIVGNVGQGGGIFYDATSAGSDGQGNWNIPGTVPGGTAFLQVYGWEGSAADYASALQAGVATGFTPVFSQITGGGALPVPSLSGMPNLVLTVAPEPTTLALCGLGAASLLLFRRKK